MKQIPARAVEVDGARDQFRRLSVGRRGKGVVEYDGDRNARGAFGEFGRRFDGKPGGGGRKVPRVGQAGENESMGFGFAAGTPGPFELSARTERGGPERLVDAPRDAGIGRESHHHIRGGASGTEHAIKRILEPRLHDRGDPLFFQREGRERPARQKCDCESD